jgi:predicted metal-dependent peptidase
MKKVPIIAIVFGLIFSTTVFAQNIENVKKETTVKTVTVKDTDVQTVVEKDVEEKVSVIKVEGTDKINQASEDQVIKEVKTKSLDVVEEGENKENQKRLDKMKKEEAKRIDGQQRGVPVQTEGDVPAKPLVKDKKKKGDG